MIGATQEMSVEAKSALRTSPPPPPARPALSVVCTVYNEEEVIPELLDKLALVLSSPSSALRSSWSTTDRPIALSPA